MKRITLFIGLVLSCAVYSQTGTPIYTFSDIDVISPKSSFVEPFYVHNNGVGTTPYTLKKTYSLTGMNAAYGQFSVRISKYKGYEDEPGIGNVIQLYRDNTCILTLSGSNGFTSLSSYVNGVTGDFLFKKLTDDLYILVFTEWIYASQPPMISMVLIYKNQAKLMFNKEMIINSIKLTPFEMELQANTVEYVNNLPTDEAILCRIWWNGYDLRFEWK